MIKSKAKSVEECMTLFEIDVPKEAIDKAFEDVYAQMTKSANIPGFRAGKAPKELVKKHYAKEAKKDLVIGTESGIIHRLQKENPGKRFFSLSSYTICPNMKMNSLETVRDSLRLMKTPIRVPEDIRIRAKKALDRMLEVGR